MPLTIGTNISSLQAQRRLNDTGSSISQSYQRLSSGLRISTASDDPAGLAIAQSLNSSRRVFNQGIRNFNDGISSLNIAESAINELTNIVTRIRELAQQSSNGSYSSTQRKALDTEAQALSDEYFRIAKTTKFNGINLLDGSTQNIKLQGGFGSNGAIVTDTGGAIGNATFTTRTSYAASNVNGITVGDLNNDGIVDFASVGASSLLIHLGNANGGYTSSSGPFAFSDAYELKSGDLNNDGFLDLVITDSSYDRTYIYLNNSSGNFQHYGDFDSGTGTRGVTIADFNNDGKADLGIANSFGIGVYRGLGNGSFSPTVTYSAANAQSVTAVDLNNDGILDLASAESGTGRVSTFFGLGNGSFGTRVSFLAQINPWEVLAGDLNNDGYSDLVVTESSTSKVYVMLNNGSGSFSSITSYATGGTRTQDAALGDINGDGFLDIVASNRDSSTIHLLIGAGNGSFTLSATQYTAGGNPNDVQLADFNGDGVLDLASAETFTHVGIYLGNTRKGTAPLLDFSLRTRADSLQAIGMLDKKLTQLAQQRGTIGAYQSRLSHSVSNLFSLSSNYASAESRIKDADIATESANLIKLQIMQQTTAAVLAQANQQPQLVIKLLNPD